MKRIYLFAALLLASINMVSAQKKNDDGLRFSVGAELQFPTGSFSDTHSFGIGATAQVEYPIAENLNITGTGGIIFYNGKSVGNGFKYEGINIIPLRVGAKYFLVDGFYAAGQVGVGFISGGNGTAFAYSPQFGYEFKTKSDKALDASVKYEGFSKSGTLSQFGFRLAYIF